MLQVGDKYSEEITISQHQVNLFIEMTGDKNPIHVSDEEAQKAGFKKKVVHGMLAGTMFGGVLGIKFPGEGSIVLDRKFTFVRPVYVDDTYTMLLKVADVNAEEHVGTMKCRLKDSQGKVCVECETRIKNQSAF
jgi:3-hydroxybutyryl-CoA dehydratase